MSHECSDQLPLSPAEMVDMLGQWADLTHAEAREKLLQHIDWQGAFTAFAGCDWHSAEVSSLRTLVFDLVGSDYYPSGNEKTSERTLNDAASYLQHHPELLRRHPAKVDATGYEQPEETYDWFAGFCKTATMAASLIPSTVIMRNGETVASLRFERLEEGLLSLAGPNGWATSLLSMSLLELCQEPEQSGKRRVPVCLAEAIRSAITAGIIELDNADGAMLGVVTQGAPNAILIEHSARLRQHTGYEGSKEYLTSMVARFPRGLLSGVSTVDLRGAPPLTDEQERAIRNHDLAPDEAVYTVGHYSASLRKIEASTDVWGTHGRINHLHDPHSGDGLDENGIREYNAGHLSSTSTHEFAHHVASWRLGFAELMQLVGIVLDEQATTTPYVERCQREGNDLNLVSESFAEGVRLFFDDPWPLVERAPKLYRFINRVLGRPLSEGFVEESIRLAQSSGMLPANEAEQYRKAAGEELADSTWVEIRRMRAERNSTST